MNNNPLYYPYSSNRMVTYAKRAMVATSQQLAAGAGLDIIKKGGNAIDAAIATAACLTVIEPISNGIGSDCFALVWYKNKLHGLNSSGAAPMSISIDAIKADGHDVMPKFGWTSVTVSGAPGGWAELSRRFGKLSLSEALQPAIDYAENGYPVSARTSNIWQKAYISYKKEFIGEQFKYWFDTFAPDDKPPMPGDIFKSKAHAETLKEIGETNAESFYKGDIADKIDAYSKEYGGYIRKQDLAAFTPEWVDPISVNYRGYDVWELPPNGQGMVALMALNMMKGFDLTCRDDVETIHKQIEAIKIAFADGKKYITDKRDMKQSIKGMLSDGYADERRALIGEKAGLPIPGQPPNGGTVYLATADGEGNMVSFIQSNYMGFGSGLVVPDTGISLQNRGCNFSLNPSHDNCLMPGKKTYHTIIPGFLSKDDKAIGPFGVMGGFMQPQGHLQVIMNTIDFNMNPQSALDAPRWQWIEDKKVMAEYGIPLHIVRALKEKGHEIEYSTAPNGFGHGQIIWRNESGLLIGGTEPRMDGAVVGW